MPTPASHALRAGRSPGDGHCGGGGPPRRPLAARSASRAGRADPATRRRGRRRHQRDGTAHGEHRRPAAPAGSARTASSSCRPAPASVPPSRPPSTSAPEPADWVWLLHDDCATRSRQPWRSCSPRSATTRGSRWPGPRCSGWATAGCCSRSGSRSPAAAAATSAWSAASTTRASTTASARCWPSAPPACWCAATCGTSSAASTPGCRCCATTSTWAGGPTWPATGWSWRPTPSCTTPRRRSHRRRPVHVAGGRLHRLDRQHALYVLLANLPLPRLLIAVAAAHRRRPCCATLGLLAGKRPAHAADEALALLALLGRPDRLVRARRDRRRTRRVPARTALPLLAPRAVGVRHAMETLSLFLGTRAGETVGGRHGWRARGRPRPGRPPTRPTTCRRPDPACCAGCCCGPPCCWSRRSRCSRSRRPATCSATAG